MQQSHSTHQPDPLAAIESALNLILRECLKLAPREAVELLDNLASQLEVAERRHRRRCC